MEVSNKTLGLLLVAAVAISLFGTVISINKLNQFGQVKTTGYATSTTGTASVNVNTSTSIIFAVSSVDWGTGQVNATAYFNCTLATDAANSEGCIDFTSKNGAPFILENDGGTLAVVNLASNATGVQFIGGDAIYGGPQFKYKVSANETSSCAGSLAPATYTDVNVTGVGTTICSTPGLNSSVGADSLKIDILVNIPYTAAAGQKAATLTATAS